MVNILNLQSIFLANGVGIFLLLVLRYVSIARIQRARPEDRIFAFMVFGVMIGCLFEAFSYAIDGKLFTGSILLNYIANTYLFTINLLLPLALLFYVDLGLYGDPKRLRELYKPQKITAGIMISLTLLNLFVPVIYRISEQNLYSRMPLSYLFYVLIIYYCFTALYVTKQYEKANGTRSFFSIRMFLFPILLGTTLQFIFYGLSLAWLSASIGLVGLYMMQQNEMAYIDPLVDTYNRQYLNNILSAWSARGYSFTGMMLDIDHFKQINDTYGHTEGDSALKTATDLLKTARTGNELVFRFAGDEFIILKLTSDKEGLQDYIQKLNQITREHNQTAPLYPLSFSYGTSFFQNGEIDAFIKEMDSRMYQMKEKHHAEQAATA